MYRYKLKTVRLLNSFRVSDMFMWAFDEFEGSNWEFCTYIPLKVHENGSIKELILVFKQETDV